MHIRMADAGSCDANQNVRGSDLGNWDIRLLERFSDLNESHSSHDQSAFVLASSRGFSVWAKDGMQSLGSAFLKNILYIRYKPRVEYSLRACPPLLCALARQNGNM